MKVGAIPPSLRDLVPLVEKWGRVADTTRHAAAESATNSELRKVSEALAGRHREIEDWLYSFDQGEPLTDEAAAFQSLVLFELEECGGPGLRGWLEYSVAVAQEEPSAANLKRLGQAYRYTQRSAQALGDHKVWGEQLRAAEKLLGLQDESEQPGTSLTKRPGT